jgi:diaminopimelate epimerase
MNFTKLQGAGNDFILVETDDTKYHWSKMAQVMCDRHFGIGADGLLLLLPSERADVGMRVFNSDGSEAEACGNGIRCLAKYVLGKELLSSVRDDMLIETIAGIRRIRLIKTGEAVKIQVGMGTPQFGESDIPVVLEKGGGKVVDIIPLLSYSVPVEDKELVLNLVSMGNPHAVCFWQQPLADFPLSQIGPRVEHLPMFPNRINFEIVNVTSQRHVEARVWERGAGETLACGTGACAIAVAAQLHGYVGQEVDIRLPGGILQAEWDGTGEVLLSGGAEIVFTGEWKFEE